jgi:DNA-binding GntR family transcriptional regulator
VHTLDALWDKADRYRRLALATGRDDAARDRSAREHAELVELVVAGDGERAARVMRGHVESSLGAAALGHLDEAR